jgi:NAD-dependent SIR2 family protein deacetylase
MDRPLATTPTPGLEALADILRGRRAAVLSGAGVSTESGIPDYRGPASAGAPRNPIRYQQFVGSPEMRQRYWARSLVGWPTVQRARPNGGHHALAQLEDAGVVGGVLTQNVDGLHQAAGSRAVLELHGSLAAVRCLECRRVESRRTLQERMLDRNPRFRVRAVDIAPDGDADVSDEAVRDFRVPGCAACGGVLKPDVVFFGENVPRRRLEHAWRMYERADALIVVGSSLTVFSGFRFVKRAAEEGKPVAILNDGPTRGDELASVRVPGRLGELLPALHGFLRSA